MSTAWYERLMDTGYVPDMVTRVGIRTLLAERLRDTDKGSVEGNVRAKLEYVRLLKSLPIAIHTAAANVQHYEVPTEFYLTCLGRRLKYSCALYAPGVTSLDEAEEAMFAAYCERAQLRDGQEVLDLGCGWGSLSLYLAEKYPNSRITGLSNSATQKSHIMGVAERRGFRNLDVVTADIVEAELEARRFDRVLSIEMFEHMKNYQMLLAKVASWLKDDGLLFVHIFVHKTLAYDFEVGDGWMSQHFFTGGTMPSLDLLLYFQDDVTLVDQWYVNGTHYAKTCEDWLRKTDQNYAKVLGLFGETYGKDNAVMWVARWRVFFMACAELFNYNGGNEWGVCHYLFKKKI